MPQTTCVQMFTASLDRQEMELQLEEMVEAVKGFYDKLRLPYQIKIAPAPGVINIAVFLSLLFSCCNKLVSSVA